MGGLNWTQNEGKKRRRGLSPMMHRLRRSRPVPNRGEEGDMSDTVSAPNPKFLEMSKNRAIAIRYYVIERGWR